MRTPPVIPPPVAKPAVKQSEQITSEIMIVTMVAPRYKIRGSYLDIRLAKKDNPNDMPTLRVKPGMKIKITIVDESGVK